MIALLHLAALVFVSLPTPSDSPAQVPQEPAAQKLLEPGQRLLSGRRATSAGLDRVVVDRSADGILWASANLWKASFAASATTFVPFLGSDADRQHPLAWRLGDVSLDGRPLAFDASVAPVVRAGDTEVCYERGSLTEVYELGLEGIEQKFLLRSLPWRGELRLSLQVATGLTGRPGADGSLSFTGERGGVRYGRAVAIDAAGRRCEVATTLADRHIELSVPAGFVAAARMPLCIDPLVSTVQTVNTAPMVLRAVDVAHDASLDQFAVVWELVFSAADSDCFVQRLDGAMNQVGSWLSIDNSSGSWRNCRIAGLNAYDRFLIVAECSSNNAAPFWISGRIVQASLPIQISAQIDIARAGMVGHPNGDKFHPDVGGDPETATPTYFTVVWQNSNALNPNQSDILFRQVTYQGALNTPAYVLDNSGAFCVNPRISKSDGMRPFASQRWAVVWERCAFQAICPNPEVRVGLIRWDGQVSVFGNPLETSFWLTNLGMPWQSCDISSPTEDRNGRRRYAFASEWWDAGTASWDIYGLVFDDTGLRLDIERNLTLLEPWPFHHSRDQRHPVVDCDGTRFSIAYTEAYSATDNDVYVSTFAFDNLSGPQWLAHDPMNLAAVSADNEQEPAIVARRSGGGEGVRYALAWRHLGAGSANHRVEARTYDGMQPGSTFVTRSTGCGGLQIAVAGVPALGQSVQFQLTNASGALQGFVCGVPVALPVSGCPGCSQGSSGFAVLGTVLPVTVPADPGFVGMTLAAQGFDFAVGPCFGQIKISDTIDFTVR